MVTLSFTIFSGQKNYNRAHMLFQVLCGFEPIFYTTHPNEEPFKLSLIDIDCVIGGIYENKYKYIAFVQHDCDYSSRCIFRI